MNKCKCGKEYNEIKWHTIYADGKRVSVGGDACNEKLDIAKALKNGTYMFYKDSKIEYETLNHCFNCGEANNKTLITL